MFATLNETGARVGAVSRGSALQAGIFHGHNPSCPTMSIWSTMPLTDMSTRDIFWGKKTAGA